MSRIVFTLLLVVLASAVACGGGEVATPHEYGYTACAVNENFKNAPERTNAEVARQAQARWDAMPTPPPAYRKHYEALDEWQTFVRAYIDERRAGDLYEHPATRGQRLMDLELWARSAATLWRVRAERVALPPTLGSVFKEFCDVWDGE